MSLKVYRIDFLPSISEQMDGNYLEDFKRTFHRNATPLFFLNMISFLLGIPSGDYIDSNSGSSNKTASEIYIKEGLDIPPNIMKFAEKYLTIERKPDFIFPDDIYNKPNGGVPGLKPPE